MYTYTVRGTGNVPQDMLRYDSAKVTSKGVGFANIEGQYPPTAARWASFGWKVSK